MKLSTKLSLSLALAALSASPLIAAPSVSGVSGTVSTGQTLRVTGAGFGTKSPAAPYVWAPFDSSINPSGLGQKTSWDTISAMSWVSGEGYGGGGAAKASDGNGNWTLGINYDSWSREGQKSYIYRRAKQNFVVSDTSQNWKIWRAWSTSGKPNIYVAANNGRAFVEYIGVESGFWGDFSKSSTGWVAEEILLKASSAINVKDGQLIFRIDGNEQANGTVLTRSSTAPDYIVQNYPVHYVLANSGLWSPAWSSNNRVWVDNVYVDTTWSRVMIGEASTYSSCHTLDIQVPSAWADGSVTITANTPSFASGARAYVYVFDSNGNVNSSGYPVTIGAGTAPTNTAPTVNAGSDQTITLGSAFSFSGSASDDGLPNNTLTKTWSLVSGPTGSTISNTASLTSAVSFTNSGTYVFRLTGSDGSLSSTDDVTVTVNAAPVNAAPTANAGADATLTLGTNASLTGTGTDDGLPSSPGTLSYAWSYVSGPSGSSILTPASRTTGVSFTTAGTYVFKLTVSDGLLSATDTVQVTVNAPAPVNQAPSANAGSDVTVTLGANASLAGSGTDDGLPSSPGALSYAWSYMSGPTGSSILAPTSASTGVSFTTAGTYVFKLTVSDGLLNGTDTVQVTVNTPPNAAPSASAGSDVTVTLGSAAPLNGTATDDGRPSGSSLTTTWSKVSGASGATIANASSLSTTVSFTTAGTYVFRLTASDGSLSATDDVTVTVNSAPATNLAPTVNAGADFSGTAGQRVALSGRVSDDGLPNPPANTTVSWTAVSGPGTPVFADAASLSSDVTFPAAGTYVLRLTASDGALSATDDVTATVQAVSQTNFAPVASAGSDMIVTLPNKANLSASATDDGLPSNTLTYLWGKVSGPGTVSFGDVNAPATDAAFSTAGLYVLAMTVSDGQLTNTAQISVDVRAEVAGGAGPTVLGLSGRFQTGQQLQIVGTNFGTKSPAAPLIYADFESGIDPSSLGQIRSWSGIENMQWTTEGANGTKGAKAADGNGVWTLRVDRPDWTADGQKIYIHRRERENFLVTDQSQAWKLWRMWPATSSYPNVYASPSNGRVYVENIGTESGFWGSFRQKTANWSTTEVIFQASSAIDKKDGLFVLRYDGVEQARGSVLTRSTASPKVMEQNYVVHGVAASKSAWAPAWSTNNRMWVDDVYVDNTWARVMLGDAATYASCRKFDIQIPTAWSAGTVTFVARTTAFTTGDRAYLYVFDKDGNVNATGFPVKIGSKHLGSLVDSGDSPSTGVEQSPRNVFNPARGESASLPYALKERGAVKVLIYDRGGRRVKEITGDEVLEGDHTLSWDGRNDEGSLVASGIYIAVVKGSEGTRSRQKIAVIK